MEDEPVKDEPAKDEPLTYQCEECLKFESTDFAVVEAHELICKQVIPTLLSEEIKVNPMIALLKKKKQAHEDSILTAHGQKREAPAEDEPWSFMAKKEPLPALPEGSSLAGEEVSEHAAKKAKFQPTWVAALRNKTQKGTADVADTSKTWKNCADDGGAKVNGQGQSSSKVMFAAADWQGFWKDSEGASWEVKGDQLRDGGKVVVGCLRSHTGINRVMARVNKAQRLGTISAGCIKWDDGVMWTRPWDWIEGSAPVAGGLKQPRVSGIIDDPSAPRVSPLLKKSDTYGYDAGCARGLLSAYLSKQKLPIDIPCLSIHGPESGAPPFKAELEINGLPRDRRAVLSHSAQSSTKKEAINQCALLMCVELCKRGEMAPFRTKNQIMKEGLQPCCSGLSNSAEERLQLFVKGMLPQLKGLGMADEPKVVGSLQRDFDSSAWATQPESNDISWAPATWGTSPWGPKSATASQDEDTVNGWLLDQLSQLHASRAHQETQKHKEALPVAPIAPGILQAIKSSPVVMISGSTGCGKTTQVPQMLLDDAISRCEGTKTNIICTQPRRIAAITAAERIASERGEKWCGESTGYLVRFNQVVPRGYASICFMTTGMLLRRMQSHGLRGVSHVIIDEVHERDLDTDFLLAIIRQLVEHQPEMRVVLMSATIDLNKWTGYFGEAFGRSIEIPGRLHDVEINYIEDALDLTGMSLNPMHCSLDADVPFDLLQALIEKLVEKAVKKNKGADAMHWNGAILVFLPGWDSITQMNKRLKQSQVLKGTIQLHCLHSQIPKEEQQAAFPPAPPPLIKVILSTNIAESSVTISDVVYVIDLCRVKQMVAVTAKAGSDRIAYRLTNLPASKQNLTQRAGRAGRVRAGVCYRLCSRQEFKFMQDSLPPEMVRLPLHQVALTLKSLNLGMANDFLAWCPDPPPEAAVSRAVLTLQELKALDENECITHLGVLLAKLPIEPRMGFALLTSCMMGLGEPMAILCAFNGCPSPYINEKRRATNDWETAGSQRILSDHHDLLMTFYRFKNLSKWEQQNHCSKKGLEYKVLNQVKEASEQTIQILGKMGLKEETCCASCRGWISQLGSDNDDPSQLRLWDQLTFSLGMGVEHFVMRQEGRKVWLTHTRTATLQYSGGIPEAPAYDASHPFFLIGELRETDFSSSCKMATATCAISAAIGAARDLKYDAYRSCLILDDWAPVAVSRETAECLAHLQTILRICLLQFAARPETVETDPFIRGFADVIASVVDATDASAATESFY